MDALDHQLMIALQDEDPLRAGKFWIAMSSSRLTTLSRTTSPAMA